MPSRDAQWVIGTIVVVALALYGGVQMEVQGLRGEIQQLRGEIQQVRGEIQQVRDELSGQIRRLDDRLRAVEVTVAKIQQHLPIAGRGLPSPPPAAQPGAGGRPEMVRPPAEPAE